MKQINPLAYCIDAEEEHREVLKEGLRKKGFSPKFFSDGYKLLNYINGEGAKFKPSLILIDLMSSAPGGFETGRRILEKDWSETVPVIMFSKYVGPEDRLEAQAVGAVTCLQKPLDLDLLLKEIEEKKRRLSKSQQAVTQHFKVMPIK